MGQKISRNMMWNNAGMAGVVFGLISAAYLFINQFLSGLESSVLITIVNFILWAAKFAGCIFLMKFFMKRLVSRYYGIDNGTTFRFGMITAFCSALIYAAICLANVLIISPDLIHNQMETAIQLYGSMLDSNSIAMLDKIEAMMPQIMFFSNLVYCFLYGTILSLILSRNIPSSDPFSAFTADGGSSKTEE